MIGGILGAGIFEMFEKKNQNQRKTASIDFKLVLLFFFAQSRLIMRGASIKNNKFVLFFYLFSFFFCLFKDEIR